MNILCQKNFKFTDIKILRIQFIHKSNVILLLFKLKFLKFLSQSIDIKIFRNFKSYTNPHTLDVINLHINLFKLTLQDKNTVAIVSK